MEQQGGSYNPISVVVMKGPTALPRDATFLASSNSPPLQKPADPQANRLSLVLLLDCLKAMHWHGNKWASSDPGFAFQIVLLTTGASKNIYSWNIEFIKHWCYNQLLYTVCCIGFDQKFKMYFLPFCFWPHNTSKTWSGSCVDTFSFLFFHFDNIHLSFFISQLSGFPPNCHPAAWRLSPCPLLRIRPAPICNFTNPCWQRSCWLLQHPPTHTPHPTPNPPFAKHLDG